MTKKVYKDLLAALDQAALPVKESEYDRRSSGSWRIMCSSSPALAFQWEILSIRTELCAATQHTFVLDVRSSASKDRF